MLVGILETGHANIRSISNTIEDFDYDVIEVCSASQFQQIDKLILPGVGAFPTVMEYLRSNGLDCAVKRFAEEKPVLGICLGMQLLLEKSTELNGDMGLALVDGFVERLPEGLGRVPHIGWNEVRCETSSSLLQNVADGACVYFVHSYHCLVPSADHFLYTDFYGEKVLAGFEKGNVFGVQFHPEKSQRVGHKILTNFLEAQLC